MDEDVMRMYNTHNYRRPVDRMSGPIEIDPRDNPYMLNPARENFWVHVIGQPVFITEQFESLGRERETQGYNNIARYNVADRVWGLKFDW